MKDIKYEVIKSDFGQTTALVGIDIPFRITGGGTIQLSGNYTPDDLIKIANLAIKKPPNKGVQADLRHMRGARRYHPNQRFG